MRLQKSRSYLINDRLYNCRFEARPAPPSAMGFLDYFGASGLMWKRRACPGTQCLIHQLPPAQCSGSIPAPTPGPLPWGPRLGTALPELCSLRSSPKRLALPPCRAGLPEGQLQRSAQRLGRRPLCAQTPTGLRQPRTLPCTHTPSPGGDTQAPSWGHLLCSQSLEISTYVSGLCFPSLEC